MGTIQIRWRNNCPIYIPRREWSRRGPLSYDSNAYVGHVNSRQMLEGDSVLNLTSTSQPASCMRRYRPARSFLASW